MKMAVNLFYDEIEEILAKFASSSYKRVPAKLFDIPFELDAILLKMKNFISQIPPFRVFHSMQSHFTLFINESGQKLTASIDKSVEITQWESLTETEKHTSSVIDLFSSLESSFETYSQLLEIIKPKSKFEVEIEKMSVDLLYYVFSKECCRVVDFYCDLMHKNFKEGDFKKKALCVNNVNAVLRMIPKFSRKILLKLVKEAETLKVWESNEKRVKLLAQRLLGEICQPLTDKIKESLDYIVSTKTIMKMRIHKLQKIQMAADDSESLISISTKKLLDYIDGSLAEIAKYLSNIDSTALYKETLDLLIYELKEIISSDKNIGPHKNLTPAQVLNLKESFSIFKEYFSKHNVKQEFLDNAFLFLTEIYNYSQMDTSILILRYFDLIDEVKKNPTSINKNLRVFVHALLLFRDDSVAIELVVAENLAFNGDSKKIKTKEKAVTNLVTQFESKKKSLKE
jgi:hypothetical protein